MWSNAGGSSRARCSSSTPRGTRCCTTRTSRGRSSGGSRTDVGSRKVRSTSTSFPSPTPTRAPSRRRSSSASGPSGTPSKTSAYSSPRWPRMARSLTVPWARTRLWPCSPRGPLREVLVMSLKMSLGPEQNLFDETKKHCRRVLIDQPVLTAAELEKIRNLGDERASSTTLSTLFPVSTGEDGMEEALGRLCVKAESAVKAGSAVLILSDRGVNETQAPIPSLLATASVHHHLVRAGIRMATTLVVETAEVREVHHFALLVGYGAAAVSPYLAFETIEDLAGSHLMDGVGPEEAAKNYVKAVGKGLLKVISKMGISTLFSYCGAQIFEAVGLNEGLIDKHFTGTASRVGGVGMDALARETLDRHRSSFMAAEDNAEELEIGGEYQLRAQGQYHQWNQTSIPPLQRAVKTGNF